MPTDVRIAWERNAETHAGLEADVTVMLISLIACLANLALIAASPTFAAAVAYMGQY